MPDPMLEMLESLEPELPETAYRNTFAALATTHIHPCEKEERYEAAYHEFEELRARPYVARISVSLERKMLCIATAPIYHPSQQKGYVYEIGTMLIIIDVGNKKLRFENLTHTEDRYPHPHITTDGTLCIHDGRERLQSLLADGRYLELSDSLWNILHLVGTGTPFRLSSCWPLVEIGAQP